MSGIRKYTQHSFTTSDITLSHAIAAGNKGHLIDGDTTTECRLDTSGAERGSFTFNLRKLKYIEKIKFKHGKNNEWRIELSKDGTNYTTDQEITFGGEFTLETFFIQQSRNQQWQYIRISAVGNQDGNVYLSIDQVRVFEFYAFTFGGEIYDFEFNDSVLTTKAWNSSRYSGKQLSAAKINRFTVGDSTYGKTPVIQNYSRNIYIGNDIVGMDTAEGAAEDNSLLQFDNFSYAQTNTYITVNEDDSITLNTLNEPVEDDYSEIIGFYQAFYDDFKQGTYCKILMNDLSPKTNLRPSYPIWFNGGQFQKLLKLTPGNDSHLKYFSSSNLLDYDEQIGNSTGFSSTVYDETLLNEFYTGSLVGELTFLPPRDGDDGIFPIDSETGITNTNLDNLLTSAINYKNNSDYKGNKRFFASFLISGSEAPIRTITTGSVVSTIFRSKNLAELSTAEFKSVDTDTHQISFTESTRLHQRYFSVNQTGDAMTPALHGSGSVMFSQVDDTTPSLLIELNKSSELPEGTGNKPFIIIPHNLHPYIKDNLSYFLTQAGIDVGGNTSTVLTINPSNRLLK